MKSPSDGRKSHEPIAIIGMAGRFPGASDLETFWQVLRDAAETIGEYPGGRFDLLDAYYNPGSGAPLHAITKRGGFLENLQLFDADFFGISPREAILLDPQQRLLLELGWEALEDAGIPQTMLAGSQTGVFAGQWTSDFEACLTDCLREPHFYATTGSGRYAGPARLAYHLDLRGPNLTVDTGCSSSLVAVHLACESLRVGQSDLAVAGAVNLILRPEVSSCYASAGMLSPDGRCKFGDAAANGYVRSEAAAVIVLKLLRRALADGDPVRAVIRGVSVNHDGHSSGLLVSPSRHAQEAMIRAALADAGVCASDLDYVEAHGTGTKAGDPVELEAIGAVLRDGERERPCLVGSVKTNIGHTEAAAGMVGLCKTVLALEHATVPATRNFQNPNPNIPWSDLPIRINTETEDWPAGREPRIAGVSSFGITGTNAHVILESAPERAHVIDETDAPRLYLLSARSGAALEQAAASWRKGIAEQSWPESMLDLAFTAANRRTHHPCRLAVVAHDRADLDTQLRSWLAQEGNQATHSGRVATAESGVVFVFPGQGGQWLGMGMELLQHEPVFREAMMRCDRALQPHTGWSVFDEIGTPAEARMNEIDRVQPALFAVMVSLAELWRSWGIEPEAVVGHSMGEVAAAVVCGALSLEDGAAVIVARSRLMKTVSGKGLMAMAALALPEAEELIQQYGGRVSIAANNSPASTILSGDAGAVEAAIAALEAREIFCRAIRVDVASHCAHMDPLKRTLEESLGSIRPKEARIPLYSTSSGAIERGAELGPAYWSRNLREPVMFAGAVENLLRDGFRRFIEINAHPVLLQAIEETASHAGMEALAVPSLRRDQEERRVLLGSLGKLHVHGLPVDFTRLYPKGECIGMPAYPWQRERYWPEEISSSTDRVLRRASRSGIGSRIECSADPGTFLFDVTFQPPSDPIESAGWCLDLAAAAGRDLWASDGVVIEDVRFWTAIAPSESGQLVVSPRGGTLRHFCLSSKVDGVWTICCEGNIRPEATPATSKDGALQNATAVAEQSLSALLPAAAALPDAGARRVARVESIEVFQKTNGEGLQVRTGIGAGSEPRVRVEAHRADGSLFARISGLQFQSDGTTGASKLIYDWAWVENEPLTRGDAPAGVVVVVGDSPLASAIHAQLESRKVNCVAIHPAGAEEAVRSLGSACGPIIWSSGDRSSTPESAVEKVASVTRLLQSITAAHCPPSLWLLTTGAYDLEAANSARLDITAPSASEAAIWGLARVISRERPELRCVTVDFSPAPSGSEHETFLRILAGGIADEQLAIRDTKCYSLRLRSKPAVNAAPASFRKDATYLITGGLGGLGQSLASFLARNGAGNLVLLGRSVPHDGALRALGQIESCGSHVRYIRADIGDPEAIGAVLRDIESTEYPLRGVFHLAGITHDAVLSDVTEESIRCVMRAKAAGAWNLHRLAESSSLDHFVLYSSITAVLSQPGQGSYAAANAYLDGLAILRSAAGLPSLSVQWGPWAGSGMMQQQGASRSLAAWSDQGIESFDPAAGLDGLSRLLTDSTPVALCAKIDWKKYGRSLTGERPAVFADLLGKGEPQTAKPESGLCETMGALPPAERAAALESHVKNVVATVLKSKATRFDSNSPLGSMGVDSLMAVEIARRITGGLGVRLPVTAIFNFPTIALLSKEISKRLGWDAAPAASPPPAVAAERPSRPAGPPTQAIAEMTDEEAVLSLVKGATPE